MRILSYRMRFGPNAAAMPRLRPLLVALTLLVFACQNYLIQTHLHGLPIQSPHLAGWYAPLPAGELPDDEDACPMCQAFVHAGAYLLPGAVGALPPTLMIFLARSLSGFLLHVQPASHIWHGRAPPV